MSKRKGEKKAVTKPTVATEPAGASVVLTLVSKQTALAQIGRHKLPPHGPGEPITVSEEAARAIERYEPGRYVRATHPSGDPFPIPQTPPVERKG